MLTALCRSALQQKALPVAGDPTCCSGREQRFAPAIAGDALIRAAFRERFTKFLAVSTGSSTRITRAVLLDTPMSIDRGEVTDKGSINQRAVLEHRSRLIDELYSPAPAVDVITLN